MGFGFGRLPGLPPGLTQEDLAAILAAAPPGASTMGRPAPFGFGPLAAPTGAPMGVPGADTDETMAPPSPFGEAPAQPSFATPGGLTLPGPLPGDRPAPYSVFGERRQETGGSASAARPLSFGPLPGAMDGESPATLSVSQSSMADRGGNAPAAGITGPEFDRRFDAAPPGEGFGLGVSQAEAMRAGLTRQPGAPSADMPTSNAIPAAGGAPAPSFAVPPQRVGAPAYDAAGARLPPSASAAPVSPAPAQMGAIAPDGAGAASDGGGGFLSRLSDPKIYNTLLGIGQGLLTNKGLGPGIAAGTAYASRLNKDQAATDLAGAEFGLKRNKLAQEAAGQDATVAMLTRRGVPQADAVAMVLAAGAGNNTALNNAMNNAVPKTPEIPFGWERKPDGTIAPVAGGPQALDYKRDTARVGAEGTAAGTPEKDYNLGEGQVRFDGATNKPILSTPAKKPESFDVETKLRGEFAKGLGSFNDVHDGYGRVIAATRQREANPSNVSPASDIGLVFGYMKMLDPGSVVREGEYATAANAAGIPERVRNAYNKAMSGEFLSPEQRQDFVGQAGELYGTARKTAEGVAGRYRGLAGQYGVDAERSVYLPEVPVAPTLSGARGAKAGGAPTDPLADARAAIARGAPRDAVMNRLLQNGINPKGL